MMIFTLMAYFLSLGHSFIPHHNHSDHSEHYHHDHSIEPEGDHKHVVHGNHLDHGLMDYIACVLGEHNHSDTPCKVYEEVLTQKHNSNDQNNVFLTTKGFWLFNEAQACFHCSCYYSPAVDHHLLADVIARRGPPHA